MVKWREDVEFVYGLCVVVSLVLAYFQLYNRFGEQMAIVATFALGVIETIAGFAAFESEHAVEEWNNLSRRSSS